MAFRSDGGLPPIFQVVSMFAIIGLGLVVHLGASLWHRATVSRRGGAGPHTLAPLPPSVLHHCRNGAVAEELEAFNGACTPSMHEAALCADGATGGARGGGQAACRGEDGGGGGGGLFSSVSLRAMGGKLFGAGYQQIGCSEPPTE